MRRAALFVVLALVALCGTFVYSKSPTHQNELLRAAAS